MNDQESRLGGMLTGLAVASVQQWSRWDDDTQRRIRDVRGDTNNALHQVRDLRNSGSIVRLNLPVVNDAQVGLAMALAESATPQIVPSGPSLPKRPDIYSNMEVAVSELHWPPTQGSYTPDGAVKETGELTATFLALTFEEVRAIIQGAVQEKQPRANQKTQIYRAINALVATLYKLDLTWEQFAGIWENLFNGAIGSGTGSGTNPSDPHGNLLTPPTATVIDPAVASVVPLGQPEMAAPFFHQNTDKVSKWRVNLGTGNVGAGQPVFSITFGAGYVKNGKPYMPVVAISPFPFIVDSVTNQRVVFKSYTGMTGPGYFDVYITTQEG